MKYRILFLLLIPPALLFLCALVTIWMPLPDPFPPALSGERNRAAAIVIGVLGMGYVIGLAVYTVSSFLGAGRALDPVLTSLGLTAESYLVFGRRYRGTIEGREVAVRFVPGYGIRPAQLNVHVGATPGVRMAIGRQRPLLGCRDCARLAVDGSEPGDLQAYAAEEGPARRLLADPATREALARLLDDRKGVGLREIYLQPERVWLRARPQGMTEERLRQWLADLRTLAEAAERLLPSSGRRETWPPS